MMKTPLTSIRLTAQHKSYFKFHQARTGYNFADSVRQLAVILRNEGLTKEFLALAKEAKNLEITEAKTDDQAIKAAK